MAESSHSRVFRDGLLDGQVCVVSGAGSGLGRETALELARLGADRGRLRAARGAAGRDRRRWPTACPAPSSTRRSTSATRRRSSGFFDGVLERHGRLDVLVNNAGGQFLSPAEAITPKGFRTVIELNVQGTWLMTHAAATKAFIPQGGGKVLSVTLSPHNGMPGMVHSGAARAAVENMMRTLAVEWARFGIKTCALAAGQFATETLLTKYPQVVVDNLERSIPIGRAGRAEEMAWLVAYLASPAGDFFSGTTITIDGARDNWAGPWPPEAIAERGRRAGRRGAQPKELAPASAARGRPAGFRGLAARLVVVVAAVRLHRHRPEALALLGARRRGRGPGAARGRPGPSCPGWPPGCGTRPGAWGSRLWRRRSTTFVAVVGRRAGGRCAWCRSSPRRGRAAASSPGTPGTLWPMRPPVAW